MKYRITDNVTKASALLLKAIVEQYGGYSEVARLAKTSRQAINNYINYGHTPLIKVYSIARSLKVSVWALSYVKLLEVFGEQSVPFETVLKELNLNKATKDSILKTYKCK